MFNRTLNLLIATCLLLIACAGLSAQSNYEGIDYCAILSESDCQLLEANEEAMWYVNSFAVAFAATGETTYANRANRSAQVTLDIRGSGQMAFDAEAAADWSTIGADTPQAERVDIFDRILTSIVGALSVTVVETSSEGTTETSISALMDSGVYLVDATTLESLSGESMDGVEWLGVDVNGAMETIMEMPDIASSIDITPMPNAADLEGIEQVLTITRHPDSEVNGVAVAVFDYEFDVPAFFKLPSLSEAMMQLQNEDAITFALLKVRMSDMLDNMQLSVRSYVGLEDFYTYRAIADFAMELDGESMGYARGGVASAQFSIDVVMTEHNQPVEVEIPEDAFILPLSLLLQMGSQ